MEILKRQWKRHWFTATWKKNYDKSRQTIKGQRHHAYKKYMYFQGYGFSSFTYGCESWVTRKLEGGGGNLNCSAGKN